MSGENSHIKLDEDLTNQMTVNKNLSQEIIVTNTDKVTILLNDHHKIIKKKIEWLGPVGIFISILATLLTAKFDEAKFGIHPELWNAIFLVACFVAAVLSVYYIIMALVFWNKGTIEDFIKKLKNQSPTQNIVVGQSQPILNETNFKFFRQTPPQGFSHIDDHYYSNALDLNKYDYQITFSPTYPIDHWRFGIKFSKDGKFLPATQRHAMNFPLFHVEKNQDYSGLKVTYYNELNKPEYNKATTIINYNEQPVIINVSYEKNVATVDILDEHKKSILDNPLILHNYKWATLFAWGDNRNNFEINALIKVIQQASSQKQK